MADSNNADDIEQANGGVDVPQLALGLSLIGLGAVLVYKALGGRREERPFYPRHTPVDITFTRLGNQITATVRLDSADPSGSVPLTLSYQPGTYVLSPPYSCQAAQNSATATFQFTVGTIPVGQSVNVTACNSGYSGPPYCITKPFP